MQDSAPVRFEENSGQLLIHFEVEEHYLKLDTFIKTAESARHVVEALNNSFFHGNLEYELIVLPPEGGTFRSNLNVWLGSAAAVFAFANTPIGSAYIDGLTGKPPIEWAKDIGENQKSSVESAIDGLSDATSAKDSADACEVGSRIVAEMTRGILEKNNEELGQLPMEIEALDEALDARADFFMSCLDDPDVKGVGFTSGDDFPIPRNSFPERAIKPKRKEKEEEPPQWHLSIENVFVTSPNWDVDDQTTRQWKGKDQVRRVCYFVIEDAEFWGLVKQKKLHADVLDVLKVQWAFQLSDGRPKSRRVLRVLEFNGETLAEPLSLEAIKAIIGSYSTQEVTKNQSGLFDDPLFE